VTLVLHDPVLTRLLAMHKQTKAEVTPYGETRQPTHVLLSGGLLLSWQCIFFSVTPAFSSVSAPHCGRGDGQDWLSRIRRSGEGRGKGEGKTTLPGLL